MHSHGYKIYLTASHLPTAYKMADRKQRRFRLTFFYVSQHRPLMHGSQSMHPGTQWSVCAPPPWTQRITLTLCPGDHIYFFYHAIAVSNHIVLNWNKVNIHSLYVPHMCYESRVNQCCMSHCMYTQDCSASLPQCPRSLTQVLTV